MAGKTASQPMTPRAHVEVAEALERVALRAPWRAPRRRTASCASVSAAAWSTSVASAARTPRSRTQPRLRRPEARRDARARARRARS